MGGGGGVRWWRCCGLVGRLGADQGGGGEAPLWLDRVHSRIDTFLKKLIFVGV